MRFQHIWLRADDGVRLHARFWPGEPGATVGYVVGHGFTGSARTGHVDRIVRRLADPAAPGRPAAPVLSLDFRGHGLSFGTSTLGDTEVRDLAAAVRWLRAHHGGPVAVLGWSMGGSVALRHAGQGGDADVVVSISSPAHWDERGTRPMRIVHWVAEHPVGRLAALLARGTRLSWRGWAEVPASPLEVIGGVRVPLLIVHGDADHYFPAQHARLLEAAAPDATLWLEPGMAHAETATTPELVDRIDAWVRAAATAPAGRQISHRAN